MRPVAASARSAAQVGPTRSAGMRPPQISCCVWAKNSISRMPPRPILMSCPSTAIRPPPLCAWICRLIEWMSSIAAKSRFLRQMNGCSSARNARAAIAVAGDGPRLDQRRALPVLPDASRNRSAPPAPKSPAASSAGPGAAADRCEKRSHRRCARRECARGRARARPNSDCARSGAGARRARRVIQKDQIDIARIVQLLAAELADDRARSARCRAPDRPDRPGRSRRSRASVAQQVAQRGADRGVGEAAQRRHLAFERPASGKLGDAPRAARRGGARCAARASAAARSAPLSSRHSTAASDLLERRVGPFLDQPGQEIPFGDRDPAEKGLLPNSAASSWRLPARRSRRGRATRDPRPPASASAASQADKPSSSSRGSAGSGRSLADWRPISGDIR